MSSAIVSKSSQLYSKNSIVNGLLKNSNLWIDFSDSSTYTTTGGLTLASVTDKSNNARTITITGTIPFDVGSQSMIPAQSGPTANYLTVTLDGPDLTRKAETIIVVYSPSTSSQAGILNGITGGARILRYSAQAGSGNFCYGLISSSPVNALTAPTYGSMSVGSITCDNGSVKTYLNGKLDVTGTANFTAATTTTEIGRASTTYPMYGNLYELIIFSDAISDDHRQLIEYYLFQKWKPIATISSPTSITGCQLWLDGNDASTFTYSSGTSISQWSDKSGNNYHAVQATPANQPTYDSTTKGVTFVQTNLHRLVSTSPYTGTANEEVVYAIFTPSATVTNCCLIGTTDSTKGGRNLRGTINGRIQVFVGGSQITSNLFTGLNSSLKYLVEYMNITGRCQVNINQSVDYVGAKVTNQAGTWTQVIGGCGTGGSYLTYDGKIHEVIVFNRALTGNERQSIRNYLLTKWNIVTANVLYPHQPYATIPPFVRTTSALDINNCTLWLDAADVTTLTLSGSVVTAWKDKSPNAYTGTSSGSPTYVSNAVGNLPAISFNGSTQYFDFGNVNNLGTSSINIYSVVKFNNTGDGTIIAKSLYGPGTGRYGIYRLSGQLIPALETSGTVVGSGLVDASTDTRIIAMVWNRATDYLYVNGTMSYSTAIANTTNLSNTYKLLVGAYNNGTGTTPPQAGMYLNGYIMEIIVYNKTLSVGERHLIEAYLAQKWSISKSLLPSTHTFKSELALTPQFDVRRFAPILWVDASDNSTISFNVNSFVNKWNDKSGNIGVNDMMVGSAARLINDGKYNGLYFDGTQTRGYYGALGFLKYSSYSIFIVHNPLERYGVYFSIYKDTTSGSQNYIEISNDSALIYYNLGTVTNKRAPFTLTLSTRGMVEIMDDGSASVLASDTFLLNGTAITGTRGTGTTANISTCAGQLHLGMKYNASGNAYSLPYNGYIHEVIVYSRKLNVNERQQVEGYLAWKWGIQSSLSSTHPYAKYPPY